MIENHTKQLPSAILVISDNPELSQHFMRLMENVPELKGIQMKLCYSAKNPQPEAMAALGAKSSDLRDSLTVDDIIATTDLVFSLHCKQIFPEKLVTHVRCINVHPGVNPYNRGWFPQVFSIMNKLPAGVTIHLMDNEVDHGAIIYQSVIQIAESDTSFEVYRKIIAEEKTLLDQNIINLISGDYPTTCPESEGNYNSIADFRKCCELDLDKTGSLREHIDLLRSLTHGTLKNAFFKDAQGRKNYIRVQIESQDRSFEEENNNDEKKYVSA